MIHDTWYKCWSWFYCQHPPEIVFFDYIPLRERPTGWLIGVTPHWSISICYLSNRGLRCHFCPVHRSPSSWISQLQNGWIKTNNRDQYSLGFKHLIFILSSSSHLNVIQLPCIKLHFITFYIPLILNQAQTWNHFCSNIVVCGFKCMNLHLLWWLLLV